MALASTLYVSHGKVKTCCNEVAANLHMAVGRHLAIEFDWKFVDQQGFKVIPVDEQKKILTDVLTQNVKQCILGSGDSLLAAVSQSPPVAALFGQVTKILFAYEYSNTVAHPIGAPFVLLEFLINLNAVKFTNMGDWAISAKLMNMAGVGVTVTSSVITTAPSVVANTVGTITSTTVMGQAYQPGPPVAAMAATTTPPGIPQIPIAAATSQPQYGSQMQHPTNQGYAAPPTQSYHLPPNTGYPQQPSPQQYQQPHVQTPPGYPQQPQMAQHPGYGQQQPPQQTGYSQQHIPPHPQQPGYQQPNPYGQTPQQVYTGQHSQQVPYGQPSSPYGSQQGFPSSQPPPSQAYAGYPGQPQQYGTPPPQHLQQPTYSPYATVAPQGTSSPVPSPGFPNAGYPTQSTGGYATQTVTGGYGTQLGNVPFPGQPVGFSTPAPSVQSLPQKYKRVGGYPGGPGEQTFLYMSIDKVKKHASACATKLSDRLQYKVLLEFDFKSLVNDALFCQEAEVDQKNIISGPIYDSIEPVLYAASNGWSTIEATVKVQPGVTRVIWHFAPAVVPTPGWGFLEVARVNTEFHIKQPFSAIDEIYASAPALTTISTTTTKTW